MNCACATFRSKLEKFRGTYSLQSSGGHSGNECPALSLF